MLVQTPEGQTPGKAHSSRSGIEAVGDPGAWEGSLHLARHVPPPRFWPYRTLSKPLGKGRPWLWTFSRPTPAPSPQKVPGATLLSASLLPL